MNISTNKKPIATKLNSVHNDETINNIILINIKMSNNSNNKVYI